MRNAPERAMPFDHLKVMGFQLDSVKAAVSSAGRKTLRIAGWASTPTVDSYDEVIEVGFFDASLPAFMRNPQMWYRHWDTQGLWDVFEPRPGQGYWAEGNMIHLGTDDDERRMAEVEEGLIRSLSVGFNIGQRVEACGNYDDTGVWHWQNHGMLKETSLVPLPACPDAEFGLMKELGMQSQALPYRRDPATPLMLEDTSWENVAATMARLLGAKGGLDIPDNARAAAFEQLCGQYQEHGKQAPEFVGTWPETLRAVTFHSDELAILSDMVAAEDLERTRGSLIALDNYGRSRTQRGGGQSSVVMRAAVRSITAASGLLKGGEVLSAQNAEELREANGLISGVLSRHDDAQAARKALVVTGIPEAMTVSLQKE